MINIARFFVCSNGLAHRWMLIACLVILIGLVSPISLFAAPPPPPTGAETCIGCHPEETETWRNSPHATVRADDDQDAGVTCEACHGDYLVGHPEEGVMQMAVDSAVCEECHADTFGQWRHSTHAQADVQCIGCHLSHSQDFRLSEALLCYSCHRDHSEYYYNTPHSGVGLTCIDCHFPSAPLEEMIFTSEDCTKCHEGAVHLTMGTIHLPDVTEISNVTQMSDAQPMTKQDAMLELSSKLQIAEQANKSLQIMSMVWLGLGIGIGGVLGIILMQVIGFLNRAR